MYLTLFFSSDSQIIPSGIETWEAFKVIAENVAKMPWYNFRATEFDSIAFADYNVKH